MKQLTPTLALLVLCFNMVFSQTYETIDIVDWSEYFPETISGNSQSGQVWTAQFSDCDSTGFFGADPANGVFRIEDTEGTCGCNCISNDPDPKCGQNDNALNVSLLGTPLTHCQTRVRFTIEANGVKCGNNDQYTTGAIGCPPDDSYLGTDLLSFMVIGDDFPEGELVTICGANGVGEFVIELGSSIFTQIQFTGGTQQVGEYYTISNIIFEGIRTSLPPSLNATVITADLDGELCENDLPIILQTIADPTFDYQWIGPDNFFSFESSPIIQNATPANSGTYYVTVTDPNGCQGEHQVDLLVLPSTDAKCTDRPTFDNLNVSVCSDVTLPSISDNGIVGTWSPGAELSQFAGQTLEFTFTPDDGNIANYKQILFVDDITLLETFGTQPSPIPIFCNTVSATYDFIDIFQLNLDMQLQINGENEIFSFILPGEFLNDHEGEVRSLDFGGVTPGIKDFFIEAISPCGEVATKTFQFIVSSNVDPLRIDSTLCEGDFLEIGGEIFDIDNPYGFVDDGFCDSSIVVNLDFLPTGRNVSPLVFSGSCGGDIYYFYDTIVNNEYVGFVGGKISNPPHGEGYLDIFTDSYNGNYLMPIPAANGCDSVQRLIISLVEAEYDTIAFELCSNIDTFVNVDGLGTIHVNADNPFHIVGDCDITVIDATIKQVQEDTIRQVFCADQDTIIDGILFNKDHPQELIFYEVADNGCNASKYVDLTFIEPAYHYINERICIGDFIEAGGEIFTQDVTDYEIYLSRGAVSGCDSIIVVNLEVVSPVAEQIDVTICKEDSYEFLGETYDINNAFGFPKIQSVLGCDSILYSVNLNFYDADDIVLDPQLCFGESMTFNEYGVTIDQNFLQGEVDFTTSDGCLQKIIIDASMRQEITSDMVIDLCSGGSQIVNGTTYDENNTSGVEIFTATSGCDSIVNVSLNILPVVETDLTFNICQGGEVLYNGTIYNESNLSGSEMFSTVDGCDSLVNVLISVDPIKESDLIMTLCEGESFDYEGVTYDQANPSGQAFMQTTDGCDSVVNVLVQFQSPVTVQVDSTICPGGVVEIGGQSFSGETSTTHTISSSLGCDSIIYEIELVEFTIDPVIIDPILCQGESYTDPVYGFQIDENYLTDNLIITNAQGCEQSIIIAATLLDEIIVDYQPQICSGQSITINGRVYDENNTTGTDILPSALGCDSTVNIQVQFTDVIQNDMTLTLCPGEEVLVNGVTYNESNPQGVEAMTSVKGCDSIITVDLSYYQEYAVTINDYLCEDEEMIVNGVSYNVNNPTGLEVLSTVDGCDSVITMNLRFSNSVTEIYDNTICSNEEMDIYGTIYNATNPSGSGVIPGFQGCDSIIYTVDLEVMELEEEYFTGVLCEDESVTVNGVVYDVNNPSGTEVFVGGAANGCDRIVYIDYTFELLEVTDLQVTLCPGESFSLEGQIFDEDFPIGSVAMLSSNGCDSIVDVTVSYYDISLDIGGVIGSCEGVANGSFVINEVSGATPPFNLTGMPGGSMEFDALPFTIEGLEAGTYNYSVFDANGCRVDGNLVIDSDRSSNIDVNVVTIDPIGQFQLELNSDTEIDRIEWSQNSALSCIDCADPEVNISETTSFDVTVYDPDGCPASTSITVFVEEVGNVFVPNVMNVNSFAGNNMFYVQGEAGVDAVADMIIFDRWGNKVWESYEVPINIKEYGWNGRFNDKIVSTGVYVYHVAVRISTGAEVMLGGDVTVLK